MAHNPQAPQGPDAHQDPAGSTQMFRAFVDEGARGGPARSRTAPPVQSAGPRVGLIVGILALVVIVAGAAWLALS